MLVGANNEARYNILTASFIFILIVLTLGEGGL